MPTPSIESCFAQLLRNSSSVVALVGDRIHLAHRPQGDNLPSIVIRLGEYGDDQTINNDEDHVTPRVSVDCYAYSYTNAYDLDQLVRELEDFYGQVTCLKGDNTTPLGTRLIDTIVAEDTTASESPPPDGSDERCYLRSTSFFVLADKQGI